VDDWLAVAAITIAIVLNIVVVVIAAWLAERKKLRDHRGRLALNRKYTALLE
jgi:hypothetical protein